MKDYIDSWGRTRCSGRSRCREVSTKAILWTVRQDKTSGRFTEDAISGGSSACLHNQIQVGIIDLV